MISAGIDIGSTTTKVVILKDSEILASAISPSGDLPGKKAAELFAQVMSGAGLARSDAQVITTTGYGRRLADFGDIVITEIKACAKGIGHLRSGGERVRTIIDVGGQDTKVIALDDQGDVEDFGMNDKCAAGTGRFLEVLAHKLNLSYEDFVQQALLSDTLLQMNSTCAVFAESEVVGMLARGVAKQDIAAAAHNAIASRIASMIRRVGQNGAYCFVGGGARNAALVRAIEEHLDRKLFVPEHAQLVVALGAAIGGAGKLGHNAV